MVMRSSSSVGLASRTRQRMNKSNWVESGDELGLAWHWDCKVNAQVTKHL